MLCQARIAYSFHIYDSVSLITLSDGRVSKLDWLFLAKFRILAVFSQMSHGFLRGTFPEHL